MTTAGKNLIQRTIVLALAFGALQSLTGSLCGQGLMPASGLAPAASRFGSADSTFTIKSGIKTGVNNGSNTSNYKLNLSNGLCIRAGGMVNSLSTWNNMGTPGGTSPDPAAFRRGNLIPREVLFDAQHFTFGASYNYGLNNMWRSGGFGGASKNPGLSLHAGFSF